jgi:hypothetical protein
MRFRHTSAAFSLSLAMAAAVLGGCELLGMDDPAKIAAAKDAEGKAVGGACRHSGRALEDCYLMNPKAVKAAIFAGWRDMDAYMRENKIDAVQPDLADAPTRKADKAGSGEEPAKAPDKATEKKAGAKHSAAPIAPSTPNPRRLT